MTQTTYDDYPRYSRGQALQDGLLVDVTCLAEEIGITCPTALTIAVWKAHVDLQGEPMDRQSDRLSDILAALRRAIRQDDTAREFLFTVHVRNDAGPRSPVKLKAVYNWNDYPETVITVLLPDEEEVEK